MNAHWGSIRFCLRMLICVVCVGSLLTIALPAYSAVYTYEGTVQNGAGGGAMWSFGHKATTSTVTPTGGWTQKASGELLFRIRNDNALHEFLFDDVDNNLALSAGDKVILDVDGLSLHNVGDDAKIGSLDLSGMLTVGGASSPTHTLGISGPLDFFADFTGAGLPEPDSSLSHGDTIFGTAYFQAASIAGQFNGITLDSLDADSVLKFAAWGDNRSRTDATDDPDTASEIKFGDGTHTPFDPTGEGPGEDFQYSIGFDLVVHANSTIPEPSSILVWTLLGAVGIVVAWRGH